MKSRVKTFAIAMAAVLVSATAAACSSTSGAAPTSASAPGSSSPATAPSGDSGTTAAGEAQSSTEASAAPGSSSGSASSISDITLQLAYVPTGYDSPYSLAVRKGWFKDAGLNVKVEPSSGSTATITNVAGGKVDFGIADLPTLVVAKEQGIPVVAVGGIFNKEMMAVATMPDKHITTPAQLKGLSVAVTTGGQDSQILPAFLEANGLTGKMKIVNVSSAGKTAAFLAGKVDAFLPSPCGTAQAVKFQNHQDLSLLPVADYGLNLLGLGLVTNESVVKEHPDWIRSMNTVIAKAFAYAKTHQEESVDAAVAQFSQLNSKLATAQLDCSFHYLQSANDAGHSFSWMSPKDWAETVSIMTKATGAKALPAASYYTNDFTDDK